MAEGPNIALEIGRRRVRAVHVSRGGQTPLSVRQTMVAEIPRDLQDGANPEKLGAWLGERLRQAAFPRGKVMAAIPREHVGLKRMFLPTVDDAELPEMVRLAMHRELPFDPADIIIDFVPHARPTAAVGTHVLAVAARRPMLESLNAIARSAGLTIGRVSLSTMGSASLVRATPTQNAAGQTSQKVEACLVIDVSGDNIELTVVVDDTIRFSRSAVLPDATSSGNEVQPAGSQAMPPLDHLADVIITEARRTWTSYRTADDAVDMQRVVLIGNRHVLPAVAEPLQALLGVQPEVLESHPDIDGSASNARSMEECWPLVGLLLEASGGSSQINLSNPRRAPDLAARRRQRVLLAAAAGIVGIGVIATAANLNLKSLRAQAAALSQARSAGSTEFARYWRDMYKLEHVRQWRSSGLDWLEQADYLMQFSPGPGQIVLDSWSGSVAPVDVRFDARARKWTAPREVTIVLDGEARDRETADAFREGLVARSSYSTSSTGADSKGGKRLPFGFTYRLRLNGPLPVNGKDQAPVSPSTQAPGPVASAAGEGGPQ